jgi:predicted NBD/HSP70 family sugar kinase
MSRVEPVAAIDQSGMRRVNTGATLRALAAAQHPATSAELVDATGLSRRTIELIVADLIADGWVHEVLPVTATKSAGRPKKYYELLADRALVLSVYVDYRVARAWLADVRGEVVSTAEASATAITEPGDLLALGVAVAAEALELSGRDPERLVAAAVGTGGTFSPDGVVLTSPVGEEWVGVDVGAPFADRFGVPVRVENDSNLAALGEHARGAVRDVSTFVLLTPGNRVSAGVVIDGELYRGFQGAAGELIRIPDLGIHSWHEHPVAMISSPEPDLRESARDLIRRASMGEPDAEALVEDFFSSVAHLVAVIAWVLAPPVLVVGGAFQGLEEAGARFVNAALRGVDLPQIDVRIARLDTDAALIGGVQIALAAVEGDLFGVRL